MTLLLLQPVGAQRPARQIEDIQRNTTNYIHAESTDPDEGVARRNAMRQMIDVARNYVNTNNNGVDISDSEIEGSVKLIVKPHGDFKRVFLYTSISDLLQGCGEKVAAVAKEPAADIAKGDTDAETGRMSGVHVKRGNRFGASDKNGKDHNGEAAIEYVESADGMIDTENLVSYEDFLANIPADIKDEVLGTSAVSSGMKELIGLIQDSGDLNKAADVIYRYKNRRMVSDYGSPKESHNSIASYWVVEDNGIVTVLGPEVRGHRYNFRTGQADALYRYYSGIWFRKR